MLMDLEVFYLGHLKNFYTVQYNTTCDRPLDMCLYAEIRVNINTKILHSQWQNDGIRPDPEWTSWIRLRLGVV